MVITTAADACGPSAQCRYAGPASGHAGTDINISHLLYGPLLLRDIQGRLVLLALASEPPELGFTPVNHLTILLLKQ